LGKEASRAAAAEEEDEELVPPAPEDAEAVAAPAAVEDASNAADPPAPADAGRNNVEWRLSVRFGVSCPACGDARTCCWCWCGCEVKDAEGASIPPGSEWAGGAVRGLAEGDVVTELAKEDCMLDHGEWNDGNAVEDAAPAVWAPPRTLLPCTRDTPPPGAEFVEEGVEGEGDEGATAPLLDLARGGAPRRRRGKLCDRVRAAAVVVVAVAPHSPVLRVLPALSGSPSSRSSTPPAEAEERDTVCLCCDAEAEEDAEVVVAVLTVEPPLLPAEPIDIGLGLARACA